MTHTTTEEWTMDTQDDGKDFISYKDGRRELVGDDNAIKRFLFSEVLRLRAEKEMVREGENLSVLLRKCPQVMRKDEKALGNTWVLTFGEDSFLAIESDDEGNWHAGYNEYMPYEGNYMHCRSTAETPEEAVRKLLSLLSPSKE